MYERILSACMKKLGFSPALRGYHALRLAIIFALENPALLRPITKRLYPIVVDEMLTTPLNVERRIRVAIESAWINADVDFVERVFQYSIDADKGKPTNLQFISTLAEYIRLEIIFNAEEK